MTHDEAVKVAREIVDNFWRSDEETFMLAFASALQQAYREGMEAAAVIAKTTKEFETFGGEVIYGEESEKAIREALDKVEGK